MAAATRAHEITTSRLRTHVLESGSRELPTLVLIHGNVSSGEFFAPTMAALSDTMHCLAPDLRGYGRSQSLPVDARRGLRDYADDLHALLTDSDLVAEDRPVHLLGWSLGAGVVLQYAIDHPHAVASVVLESPMSPYGLGGTRSADGAPCWPDYAGSGGGTANPDLVHRLATGDRSDDAPTSPRQVLTSRYVHPPFTYDAAIVECLLDGMLATVIGDDYYPGDARPSDHWPGIAPGDRGILNAISPKYCDLSGFARIPATPPVLWLRGDADEIVSDASPIEFGTLGRLGLVPDWPGMDVYPPQPMLAQTRTVLDAYRQAGGSYQEMVLAGCGHSPHLERPTQVTEALRAFLHG